MHRIIRCASNIMKDIIRHRYVDSRWLKVSHCGVVCRQCRDAVFVLRPSAVFVANSYAELIYSMESYG